MFVIPAPGRNVRDPAHRGKHLPAEGLEVPETVYWLRRLRAGDVALAPPPVVTVQQIPDSSEES
jgi:hypothetical protein